MADEKPAVEPAVEPAAAREAVSPPPTYSTQEQEQVAVRPRGWKYTELKVGGFSLSWYASPSFQLVLVSFVCFMCPGMFNALSSLGGGGNTNQDTANKMNIALYSCFAVFGFFGGSFVNRLGVRLTLAFGGIGYCVYAISLLVSVHSTHVAGFNIFAGALLGLCAGLLWTAQGTIMLSYPGESAKGRAFAVFWSIFNLGGVIGSLIPLGQNFNVKTNVTVTDGTYIAFIVLMATGAILALLLCNAGDVYRPDGSRVVIMKNPTWKTEFIGLWETIRSEPYIVLLFPLFWSSNWFTAYQFNAINGVYFSTRTKSLNSVLYWTSQIIGAGIFGTALDSGLIRRSLRAKINLAVMFTLTMAIWGGGYAFAKGYTRLSVDPKLSGYKGKDWSDSGYIGPMFLFMFYGFYDAAFQASAYWYMGALSNSGRKTANYVGFYKGIQSAGAAVSWAIDLRKVSFMSIFASNWALLAGSLVIAAPLVLRIKDHVDIEEDLKYSDETIADVLPTGHPEKQTA
ncbi:DUF895 domain membrane protein [Arthroderma uncinatum]|uniref:DUF895 domain membrane protein n=1 Tax=Arthroderma uncinatum TaxID=74035 RepID=UPI00144ADFC1|nr:DUF895 domain membrane protein [Arthroderma uncinatum]KAF3482608.1 DUF895 domain membrane protein [Arthroderma uncinatum]